MADLNKEELDPVDRTSKPAEKECDMLGKTEELKDEVVEEKQEEEPSLPKLSAAEFRAYNSMAEHMEYFVSTLHLNLIIHFSSSSDERREKLMGVGGKTAQPLPPNLANALQRLPQ
jgi:hypothetical protein